jgi:hypothetical protein
VVDDVLEEYRHARVFQVLEVGRVVNQLRNFVQAELQEGKKKPCQSKKFTPKIQGNIL